MAFTPINLTSQQKGSLKPLDNTSQMGGIGGNAEGESPIEEMLKMAALADPKNLTRYKGLLDIFGTPKQTTAERKEEKAGKESMSGGLSKLKEIYSILEQNKGQDISGIIPSWKTKLGGGLSREGLLGKLLAPSQATNTLQAAISDYNTRLFEIAGKAFTGPEKSILEGLILSVGDDEARMKDKMAQAQKMIQLRAQQSNVTIPNQQLPNQTGVPTSVLPPSWRPD